MFKIETLYDCSEYNKADNNPLYDLWISRALSLKQAEIFLANYFARTIQTAKRTLDVIRITLDPLQLINDDAYRLAVITNISNFNDEININNPAKSHVLLLNDWINNLLTKMSSNITPIAAHFQDYILPTTAHFTTIQEKMYNSSVLSAVGASLAQEKLADKMMKVLNVGFLDNYAKFYEDTQDIYSNSEYFAAHVFGVEEEHANLAYSLVKSICKSDDDFLQIQQGFKEFCTISIDFWNGLHKAMLELDRLAA